MKAGRARACAERTLNMPSMSVTLDVSKLSGWLNAVADCRVTAGLTEGDTRGERCEGVGGGGGACSVHGRPNWTQGTRGSAP